MTTKWRHFLTDGLTVAGIGLACIGLLGVTSTRADETHGDIKIHIEAACADQNNEPKPGQEFWISGDGFDSGIELWLAVTYGVNATDPIVIGPTSVGSTGSFCAGPFTVAVDGHYKVYVGHEGATILVNHEKTKVFKTVDTPETTTTVTDTTGVPVTTAVPTTTAVPGTTAVPTAVPTTVGVTTTTQVASQGPVPTTTAPASQMPVTGGSTPALVMIGFALATIGIAVRLLGRRVA